MKYKFSKYDMIGLIKHFTERVEVAIKTGDTAKAYAFSHELEDLVHDLAFDLCHEVLEEKDD